MNSGTITFHIDILELVPAKHNLDMALWYLLGDPYYGDGPLDSSPMLYSALAAVILVALALVARMWRAPLVEGIVPKSRLSVRTLLILAVELVYLLMASVIGEREAKRFLPIIGTLALFILLSNLMGLLPGFASPTSSLNATLACALIVFFITHLVGVQEHGWDYIKHFFGPVLAWWALPLMLLFFIIEVIGQLARPLSLSVRLFGNIMADHMVVVIFLFLLPFLVPIPLMALSMLVAVIQTLVFSIISTVYISISINLVETQ